MAKHRIHPRLAALSASAIAAVYAVGYVHTQPAADSVASAAAQVVVEPTLLPTALPTATSITSLPTAIATSVTAAYKDGTYSGMGTSRFGNVEVAVTVAGGKITDVALTRVTTKYPASRIAALPGQVVARQSARVDNVSGATASATPFRTAVQAALAKAA
jgi:uncharacterized protein with FMN-binding domain